MDRRAGFIVISDGTLNVQNLPILHVQLHKKRSLKPDPHHLVLLGCLPSGDR